MTKTFSQIYVHFVWGTKWRRPWIACQVRPKLHTFMAGVVRTFGVPVLEIDGMDDHVHMLCSISVNVSIPDLIGQVKRRSTWWMRERASVDDFLWQEGYGAFSVSHSQLLRVRQYIQQQEIHHRRQAFADEYEILLRHHGLGQDGIHPIP